MDKVVIFGGYEFLSFYLCEAFLEMGIQVNAIEHDQQAEDLFLEHKRLSIGRNANFTEISLEKSEETLLMPDEKLLVVLSFYDYFNKEESIEIKSKLDQVILEALKIEGKANVEVLFLLPVQFLETEEAGSNFLGTESKNTYKTIFCELNSRGISNKSVYLPTLYGPWQPLNQTFQEAILSELSNNEIGIEENKREYTQDALFVSDAITEIMNFLGSRKQTICCLTSPNRNGWEKCADFLEIKSELYNRRNKTGKTKIDIPMNEVNESIGYIEVLTLQKQHLMRILEEI